MEGRIELDHEAVKWEGVGLIHLGQGLLPVA
jgi:hypothetical protein